MSMREPDRSTADRSLQQPLFEPALDESAGLHTAGLTDVGLFEVSPVATLYVDWTRLSGALDLLRHEGVTDLESYVAHRPGGERPLVSNLRVLRANRAAERLLGSRSTEALIDWFGRLWSPISERNASIDLLIDLWAGNADVILRADEVALGHRLGEIVMRWSSLPTIHSRNRPAMIAITVIPSPAAGTAETDAGAVA